MIQSIFWDNDGVLVDTEKLYFAATRETLAGLGVNLSTELHHQLSFADNRGVRPLLEEKGYPESVIQVLRTARNRRYVDLIRRSHIEITGAREVLQALFGRVEMILVTSSLKDHLQEIQARTGILDFMGKVVANGDAAHTKPAPDPYLKAHELSGHLPADCLAIEDSQRGVEAAHAAGLSCWAIPTELTRRGDFSKAERLLGDIREVPALLGL